MSHLLKCHHCQWWCKCSFYSLVRVKFVTQPRSEILMQSKPYSSYSYNLHSHRIACSSTAYWQFMAPIVEVLPFLVCNVQVHYWTWCSNSQALAPLIPPPQGTPFFFETWFLAWHMPPIPCTPSAAGTQLAGLLPHSFSRLFCSQLFSFATGFIRSCVFHFTCLNLLNYSRLELTMTKQTLTSALNY